MFGEFGDAFFVVAGLSVALLGLVAGIISWLARRSEKRLPIPMNRESGKNYVLGYMCLIDFECELGAAMGGNRVFPNVEDCREHRKCTRACAASPGCGIVEVKVEATRVVEGGNYP